MDIATAIFGCLLLKWRLAARLLGLGRLERIAAGKAKAAERRAMEAAERAAVEAASPPPLPPCRKWHRSRRPQGHASF